jgi:plasmid replication initiation protein
MAKKGLASIVKKSNILCRASWAPEVIWEARLVALVASKINVRDKDFHIYEIPIADVLTDTNRGGESYKIIDKATDYSMARIIKIQNEKTGGWVKYSLFSKCEYDPQKGNITVRFDPDLKPHYLNLKKQFAKYDLSQFLLLPSTYSQRLYEILKSWDDRQDVKIKLSDLHIMLNVPKSLKSVYKNFRRRVLEKAHTDIIKHTSLKYQWEPIKKGRKVEAIKFIFSKKQIKKVSAKKDPQQKCQTQKQRNNLGQAAIKCHKQRNGTCKEDQPKGVCEVCKIMFPR